jgi:LysM repeat protein
MLRQIKLYGFAFLTLFALFSSFVVDAQSNRVPDIDVSPYDLVNAVNELRSAYGLPAYGLNLTLMLTAQNQADFMSATGNVTHLGSGGINFTDRLLAAGYPLGGDLSAGGFRSENIISGIEGMSANDAVRAWMGDAPHQTTMLSQYLTEIGAGAAVVNGRVYFVIDCARPKTGGVLSEATSVVESGAAVPAEEALVGPVIQSTSDANGEIIHEVQSGQTLWQIAIAYGVKIDDIKRLNNILDNNIVPGAKLLINEAATPSAMPLETPTLEAAVAALPSASITPALTITVTHIPIVPVQQNNTRFMASVAAVIVLVIIGGSLFTRLGKLDKDK